MSLFSFACHCCRIRGHRSFCNVVVGTVCRSRHSFRFIVPFNVQLSFCSTSVLVSLDVCCHLVWCPSSFCLTSIVVHSSSFVHLTSVSLVSSIWRPSLFVCPVSSIQPFPSINIHPLMSIHGHSSRDIHPSTSVRHYSSSLTHRIFQNVYCVRTL